MESEKTIMNLPTYHWKDEPVQPPRHLRNVRRDRFLRNYGILLAIAAAFTIYTIILSSIVYFRADKVLRKKYESQLEDWKVEYVSSVNLVTGEDSKKLAIKQEAIAAARDGNVWTTKEAFQTYCWNVKVRQLRPDYPNSIQDVLLQAKQYDFHDPESTYNQQKVEWATEVFEQAYDGELPAGLTLDHQFLEMRNNGSVCVLHTTFDFYTNNDDPWRLK